MTYSKEQLEIDKWYKKHTVGYIVDRIAAKAMGVIKEGRTIPFEDFHILERSIEPNRVKVPKLNTTFKIPGKNMWNYPMLIEAFNEANPTLNFTRADIKEMLSKKKITIATLDNATPINLREILLNPTKGGHHAIRNVWLRNFNPLEILSYIGGDQELLGFLRNYQPTDIPLSEAEQELKPLPSKLAKGYIPKVITDEIIKGNWYREHC